MLTEFLNYNDKCPLCGNTLGLYMCWSGNMTTCFKGTQTSSNFYTFDPILCTREDVKDEQVFLESSNGVVKAEFTAPSLLRDGRAGTTYLFYLCNPAGLKDRKDGDFEIQLYSACYYRSTPFLEFSQVGKEDWILKDTTDFTNHLVNKDEQFAFTTYKNDVEKVYAMKHDYQAANSIIWYYAVTDDNKKDSAFRPNIFEKTVPIPQVKPLLDKQNREHLIERFNNWILMS